MKSQKLGDQPVHAVDAIYFEDPKSGTIGLTKREYFAGLAMQGMLTNGCMQECGARGYAPDTIAKYAVMQADALIAELNKEE